MKKFNLAILIIAFLTFQHSITFAQANKLITSKKVENTDKLVKPIEEYAKQIESFVAKDGKPHIVYAEISDYNKSGKEIWKKFNSATDFEKARETNESYTVVYIWKKDGKIVQANFTYSSPSGDWVEYYYQTYRSNGTIAKAVRDLRTFYGDVAVERVQIFDSKGKELKKSKTFRNLETKKIIKESEANYYNVEVGKVYKNVSEMPFLAGEKSDDVKVFIPKGWRLETKTFGDLNKDSLDDAVLQIIETPDGNDNPKRMLMILLRKKNGGFVKSAVAKNLLLCQGCGGVLGGAATLDIKKGVLLVSQLSGSRSGTNILHRFRYEPKTKRFRLIGVDQSDFDRLELATEETSTNYLTGRQIITISKGGENDVKTEVKQKRVPRRKIYLEDVSYGN